MTLHPKLTKAGIELVKRFEGLRLKAARLENGGWTIGYGHTLSAREGAEVTPEEADALLLYDLGKVAHALDGLILAELTPQQFSALVAFAFNVGLENFKTSAVLKRVNEGAHLEAAAAIELWRRSNFKGESLVIDGLVRRRSAEKALFLVPMRRCPPVPTAVVPPMLDGAAGDLAAQWTGLADAVELQVSMRGAAALAKRIGEPGAATTAAALRVTSELQKLFPDEDDPAAEFPPAQEASDALEPAATVVEPEPEPAPEAVPEPAFEPAPEVVPEPDFEPAPVAVEEPPPPAPPPPPLFEPPPRYDHTPAEFETEGFGRRLSGPAGEGGAAPLSPNLHAPVVLLVGLFGAAMFVGALAAMVYGRATVVNLAIGLLGVICMVPAGLKLLLRAFGERPTDRGA